MVPVRKQHEIARNELGIQAAHMSQPWLCWAGVTFLGMVLRTGFVVAGHQMLLAILLVLGLGSVVFALDMHLRQHHDTLPGRLIGPVTLVAVTVSLAVFLMVGFNLVLSLFYFSGGVALCACWDYWMRSAEHRDLSKAFIIAAEKAGVGGTRMTGLRRGPRKATARLKHEPGTVTTGDVTGNVARVESALGHPPGSWTVSPDPDNAGYSLVSISDPAILDKPVDWPGPSAPGESVAKPLRQGLWQNSEDISYDIRGHHLLVQGMTGAGKTSSVLWNEAAETVSRRDAAFFAADVSMNADQFLLPLAPALHACAVTPEDALKLLAGMGRVNKARAAFLASAKLTRWQPGCGLTHLTLSLEEFADLIKLLKDPDVKGLDDFGSMVRTFRARGIRLILSAQRFDYTQVPTFIRAQMAGNACFGVMDAKDAEYGLSKTQRERGAAPEVWQASYPGKVYLDAPSIPDPLRAMPGRYFWWGDDSRKISEYMSLPVHLASARPLDDVTGEAWEAVPGPLASIAFPVPRPPVPASNGDKPHDDGSGDSEPEGGANVLQLVRSPKPRAVVPDQLPPRPSQQEAEQYVRAQIALWWSQGVRDFIKRDWDPVLGVVQRQSSWLYNTVFPHLVADGVLIRHADGRLTRWEIAEPRGDGQ
jgi:hypothetical protein